MRTPEGSGLLLSGSGIYWVLSSQLIASPSALAPGLLNNVPMGPLLLMILGIGCLITSVPFFLSDLKILTALLQGLTGWVFTVPIILACVDLILTLIGISTGKAVELNSFVSAVSVSGSALVGSFLLSYIALSEGIALLMLDLGRKFYGPKSSQEFLPFAIVCGAASFGPFSNVAVILGAGIGLLAYAAGFIGAILLFYGTFSSIRSTGSSHRLDPQGK